MAVVALASQSAHAATTSLIKIPFSFTASGKTCPAGEYTVRTDPASHIMTFENKKASVGFNWLVGPGNDAPAQNTIRLKFDTVDQNQVLDSVQVKGLVANGLDRGAHSTHVAAPHSSGR
jgi:hypothetical protein